MRLASQRRMSWALITVLLASLFVTRPAWAYELTLEQALDIASGAHQEQFNASPYEKREISIARSDGNVNACTLMKRFSRDNSQPQERFRGRHYFTVIYWNVKRDASARNHCIFVERVSGNVIGMLDF